MVLENKARKLANTKTITNNKRGFIASYSSGHSGADVTIV